MINLITSSFLCNSSKNPLHLFDFNYEIQTIYLHLVHTYLIIPCQILVILWRFAISGHVSISFLYIRLNWTFSSIERKECQAPKCPKHQRGLKLWGMVCKIVSCIALPRWCCYFLLVLIGSYFVSIFRALFRSNDNTWWCTVSTILYLDKTRSLSCDGWSECAHDYILEIHISGHSIEHGKKFCTSKEKTHSVSK